MTTSTHTITQKRAIEHSTAWAGKVGRVSYSLGRRELTIEVPAVGERWVVRVAETRTALALAKRFRVRLVPER